MPEPKVLTQEAMEKIAGGECTLKDAIEISTQLTDAYENLIEFTTYVMERVSGT